MRKRISIITLLIMLVNIFGVCMVSSAEPVNNISLQEDFSLKNNFFDQTDYDGNKIVSRGVFAGILANIAGLDVVVVEQDQWSDYVYEGNVQEGSATIFKDVDASHPYYSAIKAVVEAEYMEGISENIFAPDVNLTAKQAYTVLLNMINYKKIAEIEGGYSKVARNLGITKGLNVADNEYVTYKELAKIIYNMLDVKSYNFIGNETKTFMTEVLEMKMVKGFLTDNGYTAINGESEIKDNQIQVGDVVVEITPATEYMRNYIGREVKLYYHYTDEGDDNVAAYMAADANEKSYTIASYDFLDYTGSAIKYRKDGKSKSISLSSVQYMIYNNTALNVFDEDTFKFNSGEITVLPKSVDGKTVIIINSIEYAYVTAVDKEKNQIVNKLKNFDPVLDLNDYEYVNITSADGEEKTIADILAGNVLEIVRNDKLLNINIVSKPVSSFYINKIDDNDMGTDTLYGDYKNYPISKQYFTASNKIKLELRKMYDIYLNSKDEIVWVEAKTGDYQVGYLIKTKINPDTAETRLEICDMEARINKYYCTPEFVINDTEGKKHRKMLEDEIDALLTGVNDIIRFRINKEGLIDYVELPMDTMPEVDDRLFKIADADDQSKWGGTRYPYQYASLGFGGSLATTASVKILKIPNKENLGDYSKYAKTTLSEAFSANNNTRRFIAYTTKRNAFAAEYLVAKSYEDETPVLKDKRTFFVVKSIENKLLGVDEEPGMEIKGFMVYGEKTDVAKAEKTFYLKEENFAIANNMSDVYHSLNSQGRENKYTLQAGDIIRLLYDENSYMTIAELLFRPTLVHKDPASQGTTMGTLAGSIGYYDANSTFSNPFVLNSNGALEKGNAKYIVGVDYRLAMSWVNSKLEDVYQVTTQDLSKSALDPKDPTCGGKYMVDIIKANATSMVLVEYDGDSVATIRAATVSDIKTYDEVGANCSRIIHNWYWGTGLHGFVINGL